MFPNIPLWGDFPVAQTLLEKLSDIGSNYSAAQKTQDESLTIKFPSWNPELYSWIVQLRDEVWTRSRTLHALPQNYQDALQATQNSISSLHQPNATRSIQWLRQHGTCVDHIVPKISTIPNAGEGAFAQRDLPKDTIITSSPLHHVPNASFFNMYGKKGMRLEGTNGTTELLEVIRDPEEVIGKQIIYNYCFSHRLTTLMLCPYGVGINYINHASPPRQPNVKIQWSTKLSIQNSEWFQRSPESMEWNWETNLAFDYIALTDIAKGDELLLDYGPEFEQALQDHLASWKPVESLAAYHFNELPVLRTSREQRLFPYPRNILVRCHSNLLAEDWNSKEQTWVRWGHPTLEDQELIYYGQPCSILKYDSKTNTYTVKLAVDHLTYNPVPAAFYRNPKRTHVPRSAIFFVDAPGNSDLHLPSAFRHYIQMPDDMVPDAWKNRKPPSRETERKESSDKGCNSH